MKKTILIAVLWSTSIVIASVGTNKIMQSKRLAAIQEAGSLAEKPEYSEADNIIFHLKHGDGIEQKVWLDGARNAVLVNGYKKTIESNKAQIAKYQDVIEKQIALNQAYQEVTEEQKKTLAQLSSSVDILKQEAASERKPESPPNYSTAVPQASSNGPSIAKVETAQAPPNWKMPTRNQALAVVKSNAATKWGTDFNMIEYELNNQMEAYDKLTQYQKQNWKPLMRTLLNTAANKWGTDYRMMVYEIEKQIDAKDRIEGAR